MICFCSFISSSASLWDNDQQRAPLWDNPTVASKKELADVSKYLGDLLAKAGPDDDTPADVFQKKCGEKFDQEFDNEAWDNWFDEEIDRLEDEADARGGGGNNADKPKDD